MMDKETLGKIEDQISAQGNTRGSKVGRDEIANRYGFHKGTTEGANATVPKHADVRMAFKALAEYLDDILPSGRAKMVAFTELENASMWSHKAIAEMAPLAED